MGFSVQLRLQLPMYAYQGGPVTVPPTHECAEFAGAKTSIIAAHVMSHLKKDIAQALLAINSIDHWRNGLLWCIPVEEAWEDSRICLTYHPVPTPGFPAARTGRAHAGHAHHG